MKPILPREMIGVFDLETKLVQVDLQKEKRDLSLPRFKLSLTLALSDSLQQVWIADIFSDGITGRRDLFVCSVVQKVWMRRAARLLQLVLVK